MPTVQAPGRAQIQTEARGLGMESAATEAAFRRQKEFSLEARWQHLERLLQEQRRGAPLWHCRLACHV